MQKHLHTQAAQHFNAKCNYDLRSALFTTPPLETSIIIHPLSLTVVQGKEKDAIMITYCPSLLLYRYVSVLYDLKSETIFRVLPSTNLYEKKITNSSLSKPQIVRTPRELYALHLFLKEAAAEIPQLMAYLNLYVSFIYEERASAA